MPDSSRKKHLGGYMPGGDERTWYPDLWKWLVREVGVRSVVDVGCGEGHALDYFRKLGCAVVGVDGVDLSKPHVVAHDYTRGPFEPIGSFDLAWSCEFVEHVRKRFVKNFIATFRHADLLLMSHALPGQLGHHHVNCQESGYWVDLLSESGFALDAALTTQARLLAGFNRHPDNYFARTGLAFRRLP